MGEKAKIFLMRAQALTPFLEKVKMTFWMRDPAVVILAVAAMVWTRVLVPNQLLTANFRQFFFKSIENLPFLLFERSRTAGESRSSRQVFDPEAQIRWARTICRACCSRPERSRRARTIKVFCKLFFAH